MFGIRSKSLWRWHINTNIIFLDIIHHPVFIQNNVSVTGFCLRLQEKPSQLGPIDRASPYQVLPEDGDKIQSPKRCVLNKNRTMANVQKHNVWKQSVQTDLIHLFASWAACPESLKAESKHYYYSARVLCPALRETKTGRGEMGYVKVDRRTLFPADKVQKQVEG
jgi:hypothetical protein